MKVKELVAFLGSVDQNSEVILSGDAEGNNLSPLAEPSIGIYEPETTWYGNFFDVNWSAEDACMDEDEWQEKLDTSDRCVVLWPIN